MAAPGNLDYAGPPPLWNGRSALFMMEGDPRRPPVSSPMGSTCKTTMRPRIPHPTAGAAPPPRLANDDKRRGGSGAPGTAVISKTKPQTKRPSLYRVLLLNDDYTPMEFVVMVLQEYFKRDLETATQIMLKIHHDGRGVCGVYSKDVAATKVELVLAAARRGGHPLQCIMEAA